MCECYKYHESGQDVWETYIVLAAFRHHYVMNKSTVSSFVHWDGEAQEVAENTGISRSLFQFSLKHLGMQHVHTTSYNSTREPSEHLHRPAATRWNGR
jgi:hypothetical protein